MVSKPPFFIALGLLTVGLLVVVANMWFDETFSQVNSATTPQSKISPTSPPQTTPVVTRASPITTNPTHTPTTKTPKDVPPTPTIIAPSPTPPRSTPLPTNTPAPQSIQIITTLTKQTYICPETYATKAQAIINDAEFDVAPIDAAYEACTDTADQNAQNCIDGCGLSLSCMQNCGLETDEAYKLCTTTRDVQKDPIVNTAVSRVTEMCFAVE